MNIKERITKIARMLASSDKPLSARQIYTSLSITKMNFHNALNSPHWKLPLHTIDKQGQYPILYSFDDASKAKSKLMYGKCKPLDAALLESLIIPVKRNVDKRADTVFKCCKEAGEPLLISEIMELTGYTKNEVLGVFNGKFLFFKVVKCAKVGRGFTYLFVKEGEKVIIPPSNRKEAKEDRVFTNEHTQRKESKKDKLRLSFLTGTLNKKKRGN